MSQILHTSKHPKQDSLMERIAFFSDAVFAIALNWRRYAAKPRKRWRICAT